MSSENPIWGTPGNGEKSGHQEEAPLPYRSSESGVGKRRRRKSWVPLAAVLGVVSVGWAVMQNQDGSSSGYDPISPQDSGMCQLLTPAEVDSVLGGSAAYDDRIYDGDSCQYLSMQTDLGYNLDLRLDRRELDADLGDYYRQSVEDDITSTEAVEIEDVGEIAALDRPDHRMVFISDGVQYELTLDNNDYDDKLPSSEEQEQASAELARIILGNVAERE
ncbi:hypothetical protein LWF15_28740 [Kineosporia rhizophila]|uniref:hypothetical protein n=1 Tax=Kineosporia rhizophila TaxID=84633 RepID=UPI001E397B34|nr:hypothetical protein [Kineosporia rhizophila]MCE0539493.1 hypothetical protein [Kineosporia rhizophila]